MKNTHPFESYGTLPRRNSMLPVSYLCSIVDILLTRRSPIGLDKEGREVLEKGTTWISALLTYFVTTLYSIPQLGDGKALGICG